MLEFLNEIQYGFWRFLPGINYAIPMGLLYVGPAFFQSLFKLLFPITANQGEIWEELRIGDSPV